MPSARRSALRPASDPASAHDHEHLGLHDLLGPAPLVVHLGAEVVARDALAHELLDLAQLQEAADAEVREVVVVRELEAAVLAAHHGAEDVADVGAALAREDRALL